MSEPTKGLPTDAELRAIVAKKPAVWWAEASDIAAEILRLRAELAKASAEVQRLETAERLRSFSPPKPHQFTGSEALAPSYEASQAVAKDAPPADVLGESLRGRLCAALLDERVSPSIYGAVHELAQVVERIARQQGGGK